MKKLLPFTFLFSLLFFSCEPYYIKGDYAGFRKEVLREKTKGFIPKISVEVPDQEDSHLNVKVLRVAAHPVVKVKQYQKIRQETQAGLYGTMGLIGGAVIGAFAVQGTEPGDTLKSVFIYGAGGWAIGALLGGLIRSNEVLHNEYFEEPTDEVIGEEPGEVVGVLAGETVRLFSPRLGKTAEFRTNSNGEVRIDLSKVFIINEWKSDDHEFEILISVRNVQEQVNVDPVYWLKPYILITKTIDNIRENPWLGRNIVAKCYRGEKYRILGQKGNWYKINYHGRTAWTHISNGKKIYGSEYQFDPSRPPSLIAKIQFEEPSGNNLLDAEEAGIVHILLKNQGKGPAYNITVQVNPIQISKEIRFPQTATLTQLDPGEEKEIQIPLHASYRVPSQANRLRFQFTELFGYPPPPIDFEFRSREEQKPALVIKDIKIDDDNYGKSFGDNDNQIELGETIEATVYIGNDGVGKAENVRAIVSADEPNLYLGPQREFSLGTIPPGGSKPFSFIFSTNKLYNGPEELPIYVKVQERRARFSLHQQLLGLPLNKFVEGPQVVRLENKEKSKSTRPELNIELVPRTGIEKPYAVAVIIGNRDYQKPGVPAVEFATRDAALMKEYIQKVMGYPVENILYIENATKADFDQIFGTAANPEGKLAHYIRPGKSEVFIYYSGHGAPDVKTNEGYFVPVDCDPTYVKLTGYPLNLFYRNLSELKASQITVVIDACFSGQSNAGFLLKNISPIYIKVKNPLLSIPNLILFAASQQDQVAHWFPEKQHSLFTYYFLRALKERITAGDVQITVGDVKETVAEEVNRMARRLYGREQNPMIIGDEQRAIF